MIIGIDNYTARLASEVDSEAVYAFLEPYVCIGDRWSVERAQRRLKSFVSYYINKDACVVVKNLNRITAACLSIDDKILHLASGDIKSTALVLHYSLNLLGDTNSPSYFKLLSKEHIKMFSNKLVIVDKDLNGTIDVEAKNSIKILFERLGGVVCQED